MKKLLKNLSSQNKKASTKHGMLSLALLLFVFHVSAQVNLVGNPSFESLVNCTNPTLVYKVKYWNSIDSANIICGGDFFNTCAGTVPYNGSTFQFPKTGSSYIRTTFYCVPSCRTYPKNRLLTNLTSGVTYCVKFFVNTTQTSPKAIDRFEAFLGDISLDTITYCSVPLTFLTPQISNTLGIINDTLNWKEISGTFAASGTEKYIVIGNFKSDVMTNTVSTGVGTSNWSEYMIDDVSVIDFNLPANAGPDKNINLGDSAFIGRPPEVGLECTWATGTTTVGTGGGIWVKPTTTGTFSYVVTQNICGNIKTDTVNVNISSGIDENIVFAQSISIYPQPAKDIVNISLSNYYEPTIHTVLFDVNGKIILQEDLVIHNNKSILNTSELTNGVYILQLSSKNQSTRKLLVVAR